MLDYGPEADVDDQLSFWIAGAFHLPVSTSGFGQYRRRAARERSRRGPPWSPI